MTNNQAINLQLTTVYKTMETMDMSYFKMNFIECSADVERDVDLPTGCKAVCTCAL